MRVILPALQSPYNMRVQSSLKMLVLSGEVFPMSLWEMLYKLLPKTTILNLYGSTEVSGDCSYFDCKKLLSILDSEALSSVPIGMPISNCDLVLVDEDSSIQGEIQGEIYVGGLCMAAGYYCDFSVIRHDFVKCPQHSSSVCLVSESECQYYFKTGDFARRLQSGDLIFLGRKDRTVKVNGQRIALEEIESTLRGYPGVVDVAVIYCRGQGEVAFLDAYLLMRPADVCGEILRSSIRSWMLEKLPLAMIPNRFFFTESFPKSSTGKVDYVLLASLTFSMKRDQNEIGKIQSTGLLEVVKKAFCDALMVEMVSDDDDFFIMGGNSISVAHVSYNLGIDMGLLYVFPSPLKLQMALLEKESLCNTNERTAVNEAQEERMLISLDSKMPNLQSSKPCGRFSRTLSNKSDDYPSKFQKVHLNFCGNSKGNSFVDGYPWNSNSIRVPCSCSRCNRVIYDGAYEGNNLWQATLSVEIPRNKRGAMQELWKVHMESCVDASPLLWFCPMGDQIRRTDRMFGCNPWLSLDVTKGRFTFLIFLMATSVGVSKRVVSFLDANQILTFEGKVTARGGQMQALGLNKDSGSSRVIFLRVIRCGSHDHNLYALDYKNYCCVYKIPCGGSIYGSPVIDEVHNTLYVASTGGRVTAISIEIIMNLLWDRIIGELLDSAFDLCDTWNYRDVIRLRIVVNDGCMSWKHQFLGPFPSIPTMEMVLLLFILLSILTIIPDDSCGDRLPNCSPYQISIKYWNIYIMFSGNFSYAGSACSFICCLVDGHVVALDSHGSIIWKVKTGGPIFAGPCISYTLPSQVNIPFRTAELRTISGQTLHFNDYN
ncbi:hypothetical protein TEA_005608 [Camellia sinensis var. sinensis]|uniref:AMP-dependent synthetase/ligase domain-containing protein n=1 Tax=Camellia sinensis var. sinensis TaxID=542762 RepID=A0A4S4EHV6_CAMSN|nr:hypothetical protein TEA_005608 [Camellia sinensis var. sinensis]